MKIQSTNVNFNGRYKTLVTNEQFKYFERKIVPILHAKYDGELYYFCGKTPFDIQLGESILHTAKANNASFAWACQNAQNQGVRVKTSNSSAILWITTGEKDINRLFNFTDKRNKFFAINKIISLCKIASNNSWQEANHLLDVLVTDKALKKESKAFFKFIKKHPFKTVKTPADIIFENAVKI